MQSNIAPPPASRRSHGSRAASDAGKPASPRQPRRRRYELPLLLLLLVSIQTIAYRMPRAAAADAPADAATHPDAIVGDWAWSDGAAIKLKSDGTFSGQSAQGEVSGRWKLSDPAGRQYKLLWRVGDEVKGVETVTLSSNGGTLSGRDADGKSIGGQRQEESDPPAAPGSPPDQTPGAAGSAPPPAARPGGLPAPGSDMTADFSRGALYGRVVDAVTGNPLAGATVALEDPGGKVVGSATTDAAGRYAIGLDAFGASRLHPSRHRGMLARIAGGMKTMVAVPLKIGRAVATSALALTPIGAAARAGASAAQDARKGSTAGTRSAREVVSERQARAGEMSANLPAARKDAPLPGELMVAISAPRYKDLRGKAAAYWLEAADTVKDQEIGSHGWLETARLAPQETDATSEVAHEALLLAEPEMTPSIAPAGTPVRVRVRLTAPDDPPVHVRVFARENRTHQVAELDPEGQDVFEGDLELDPKTPAGETTITVVALHAEPVEVKLHSRKGDDPLLEFVSHLDSLDPGKPYDFDPRIMASENRIEIPLTVLKPGQEAPLPESAQGDKNER